MKKTKDVLPDKPSKLLKVALIDLMKVEKMTKKYQINMGDWMVKETGSPCQVCHAGAVMACTLKAVPETPGRWGDSLYCTPSNFSRKVSAQLDFINAVRTGELEAGFKLLRHARVITKEEYSVAKKVFGKDRREDPNGWGEQEQLLKIPYEVSEYEGTANRRKYKAYIEFLIGVFRAEGL